MALGATFATASFAEDWGSFYGKVYGGGTLANTLSWNGTDYPMDAGWLLGGAVGTGVGVPGVSVELDATASDANYTGYDTSERAVTVMGDVVLSAPMGESFAVYGGAGLGAVGVQYHNASPDSAFGFGPGGQIFVGASAAVADNVSLFGELRYQAAFNPIDVDHNGHTDTLQYNRTSVLFGLKFSH